MDDVRKNRVENLKKLIAEEKEKGGTATSLAKRANTSASTLSQIVRGVLSDSGKARSIGDDLAGRLESAAGKPAGWLDLMHTEKGNSIDGLLQRHCLRAAGEELKTRDYREISDFAVKLYRDLSLLNEAVDYEFVRRYAKIKIQEEKR